MKPLFKIIASAILLVGIFSFVKNEKNIKNSTLDLNQVDVQDLLSKQKFLDDRPNADYVFYVDTDLVQKVRGANKVNAKVYIMERATGKKSLLASENIQVKNYQDAIVMDAQPLVSDFKTYSLSNGDVVIGCDEKLPFSFDDLVEFEPIFDSYVKATNDLLDLEREI